MPGGAANSAPGSIVAKPVSTPINPLPLTMSPPVHPRALNSRRITLLVAVIGSESVNAASRRPGMTGPSLDGHNRSP
jgi:hypothetical protein